MRCPGLNGFLDVRSYNSCGGILDSDSRSLIARSSRSKGGSPSELWLQPSSRPIRQVHRPSSPPVRPSPGLEPPECVVGCHPVNHRYGIWTRNLAARGPATRSTALEDGTKEAQDTSVYLHPKLRPVLSVECVHHLGHEPRRVLGRDQVAQAHLFSVHRSQRHPSSIAARMATTISFHTPLHDLEHPPLDSPLLGSLTGV